MPSCVDFFRKNILWLYYALAFGISWGAILVLIGGPGNIPGRAGELERLLPAGVLLMVLGPSLAALIMISAAEGRTGLKELWQRVCRWRVGARWYAVALLTAPLVMLGILFSLAQRSPDYLPGLWTSEDPGALLAMGLGFGVLAGLFEEIGWTGLVTPRLRQRYSLLASGLIIGFLWGAWHYLVNFWGSGDSAGKLDPDLLLPSLLWSLAVLPAFRVLMVWTYDHTGSLLLSMLMHLSLTSGMLLFNPLAQELHLAYDIVLATVLILLAAAVVIGSRQPAGLGHKTAGGDARLQGV